MNICVYGSADELDEKCLQAARALGNYIGKNGHTLVFDGFGDGLLGTVADEAWKNGAKVISVLPEVPRKEGIQNFHTLHRYSEMVINGCGKNYRLKMQMLL